MIHKPAAQPCLSTVALGALICASPALAADAPASCSPPPASTLVVNVKDKGALGDGRTDDTAAIQAAIDAIGGTKGTVLVPKGVYMIDAVKKRLHLKDDMTLKLADGAVLKAIPNDAKKYSLLTISGVALSG
jgi:polygalacturonase